MLIIAQLFIEKKMSTHNQLLNPSQTVVEKWKRDIIKHESVKFYLDIYFLYKTAYV